MSKGETAAEPSMDEILSSIRKIIAEDEIEEPVTAAAAATTDEATACGDATGGRTDPAVTVEADEDDDDILELTEDDEITAETESEAALLDAPEEEEAAPSAAPAPRTPDAAVVEGDVDHHLVEMDQDPVEEPPAPDGEPDGPAAAAPPATATDDAAVMMNEMTEVLLDSGTATAASGALQRLSAAMSPGSAVPQGERTIEAFLADLVRPELKAWLDQHLPGLVERIVEREIKKLVRDAQPE